MPSKRSKLDDLCRVRLRTRSRMLHTILIDLAANAQHDASRVRKRTLHQLSISNSLPITPVSL